MGKQPTRYAALLAAAGLCAGALLTGCDGGEKPSPPPTGGGTVAGGPTNDSPTASPTSPTSTGDPTTPGSSDPAHTSKPTQTGSPTKSGNASPDEAGAPGVPKAARQHTMPGAEAFVRYFNKQLNIAWSKPAAGLIPPLSTSDCKTCAGYEAQAADGVRTGQHLDGAHTEILNIEITTSTKPNVVLASMKENLLKRKILSRAGKVIGHTKAQAFYSQTEVRWTSEGWQIQEVRELRR